MRRTVENWESDCFQKLILFTKALGSHKHNDDVKIFYEIFVQNDSKALDNFDFEHVYETNVDAISFISATSVPQRFLKEKCLNIRMCVILRYILVFYDPDCHHPLLEALAYHDQIDKHELLDIALEYSTDPIVFKTICKNVHDLVPEVDIVRWDSLRSKFAKLVNNYIVMEILSRNDAKNIDILLFPAVDFPEATYDHLIWNLHRENPRVEVRRGFKNSYHIINCYFEEVIFGELYPLSLALVLNNQRAAKALGKLGDILSEDQWEQAMIVANTYGFNTKTFYDIKKDYEGKCIIN